MHTASAVSPVEEECNLEFADASTHLSLWATKHVKGLSDNIDLVTYSIVQVSQKADMYNVERGLILP